MAVNNLGEPRVRSGATLSQQEEDEIREAHGSSPSKSNGKFLLPQLKRHCTASWELPSVVIHSTLHLGEGTRSLFSNRLLPRTGRRDSRTPISH